MVTYVEIFYWSQNRLSTLLPILLTYSSMLISLKQHSANPSFPLRLCNWDRIFMVSDTGIPIYDTVNASSSDTDSYLPL